MTELSDPFHFHPELRNQIACSDSSFFRDFSVEKVIRLHPEMEALLEFTYSDAEREAIRSEVLSDCQGDLWVFAYGSLMWDPALRFREVRRVHASDHARRFILKDDKGGRGSEEAPGLMAALDRGTGCDGLAYRIAAQDVEVETEILFRREMIGPGYIADFVPVASERGALTALTFLADHDQPSTVSDVSWEDQVRWIATGTGILGTSRGYLENVVTQLALLGIEDATCSALLRDVQSYTAAAP